jgi:DNA-binding protein H-NS
MSDLSDLSLEQLRLRMQELAAEQERLETVAKQRAEADKHDLAQEIRQRILDSGYELGEMLNLVQGRKRGLSVRTTAVRSGWVDPENPSNTYVRGPVPGWLRDKMIAAGADPTDKAQREAFKREHLQRA